MRGKPASYRVFAVLLLGFALAFPRGAGASTASTEGDTPASPAFAAPWAEIDELIAEGKPAEALPRLDRAAGRDAWSLRGELGDSPLSRLALYLTPNNYPVEIRGTLRDALSYRFAELLANPRVALEEGDAESLDLPAGSAATPAPPPGRLSIRSRSGWPCSPTSRPGTWRRGGGRRRWKLRRGVRQRRAVLDR